MNNSARSNVTHAKDSLGYSWNVGKYHNAWKAYLGRSYQRDNANNSSNVDNFIGASLDKNSWIFSGEIHSGKGFDWRRYDSAIMNNNQTPDWLSLVTSVKYLF